MILGDAHLSLALAPWIAEHFKIEAFSVKHLGYRDATDRQIFHASRDAGAVIMTRTVISCVSGSSMALRLRFYGSRSAIPRMLTSGRRSRTFKSATALLESGEVLVELGEMP